MGNSIRTISLDKLTEHPDNPNRMSKSNFGKLVRNIERSGRYEPLLVRPHPERDECFQLINGHHRCKALVKLGYRAADVVVWDVDDEQTDILLATLNRLGGNDQPDKKAAVLRRLNKAIVTVELGKLLPQTAKQIERLVHLKMPRVPISVKGECFANAMVFFVNDAQQEIVSRALSLVKEAQGEKTKAAQKASALTCIAEYFVNKKKISHEGTKEKFE